MLYFDDISLFGAEISGDDSPVEYGRYGRLARRCDAYAEDFLLGIESLCYPTFDRRVENQVVGYVLVENIECIFPFFGIFAQE